GDSSNSPTPDTGDDPRVCNAADNCQPLRAVKDVAIDFVESLIYFGYDRVAVVAMTGQATDISSAVTRVPYPVLPLSFNEANIINAIDDLKVFQPRICDKTYTPGECLEYFGDPPVFNRPICQIFQLQINAYDPNSDPSSCPSSNIGGMLQLAQNAYSGSGDESNQRTESLWVSVLLASGAANSTTATDEFPNGFCPENTWLGSLNMDDVEHVKAPLSPPLPKLCRDPYPDTRHDPGDTASYTNPLSEVVEVVNIYDADDFARDMADQLAALKSGDGVTIYTIGLGNGVRTQSNGTPTTPCVVETTTGDRQCGEAEYLLRYIARDAGNDLNPTINHGEYFFAPNNLTLQNIFEIIAQNISTKISE
ncbi:MAG: hypothetical protein KDD74_17305, partial [Anaerolineales bacterium]|nr:hypothetical protein [Anaerolineales bacterium]